MFARQRRSVLVGTIDRTSALASTHSAVRRLLTTFWDTPVRWAGHTVLLPLVVVAPGELLVEGRTEQLVAAEQTEQPAGAPGGLLVVTQAGKPAVAVRGARRPVAAELAE